MKEKISQVKAGALLSYLQMGLTIIVELVYTPVMIQLLGRSEFGLYNTVASTISMLSILSLGFNSSYVRFHSIYKKKNEIKKISNLNGMFLLIFLVIGFIALVCGLFLTQHLDIIFSNGLSDSEYYIAKRLMVLLTINLAISFPMGIFGNIISANERFVFMKIVAMIKTVGGPLVTIPILLMGFHSIAMVAVTITVSLIADILYLYYVLKVLKYTFSFNTFDKLLFKDMFVYTSFIAINMIVDQINLSVDNVILGRFRGTGEVAVYAVGFTLYKSYTKFSQAVSSVFAPKIHSIVQNCESTSKLRNSLTDLFIKVGRIQFVILSLACTGLIFFGKTFILLWAGDGYEVSYYVALLLIIPGTIPLIQNLGIEIQRAQNLHHFRAVAYLFMAIFNIIVSWFMAQSYGAIGSTIGTALSFVFANGILMNIYYDSKCNLDIKKYWVCIMKMLKGLIAPIILGVFIMQNSDCSSLVNFIICVMVYVLTFSISMYIFAFNQYERKLVHKFLHIKKK